MPLLSIQNLSVDFVAEQGTTHALQQISYDVNKGELVAVVGESGSGKSVTALSVLQLLPATPAKYVQGKIIFTEGELQTNLLQASRAAMQTMRGNKIAMIFQEPMTSLNPVMRCGTQVAEALKIHNDMSNAAAKEKTIALFQQVQLPNPAVMYNRYPHEISGGQKQRVMIAMAMSCEPQLLICDEPTTALDVTVQKNILQLIKQLQQQNNMGVIFISHDLGVVAEIADTIIVMYKGMIMEKGKAKDILLHPKHPYTKALLACRPALHGKKERLPTVSDFMEVNESGAIIEKEWKPMPAVVSEQNNEMGNTAIPPLLQVEHLNVWYPAHTNFLGKVTNYVKAVNDVSFHIANGETLGLVGESGCGKTTLGRAVLG
ncbi:MAG TPA: ABC transporter ATP-binding protein, partial [Chitinophagaceae bacterium]|nr:ABC transporter ATP-binding protein [Chitinophagaceae bacterium]